MSTTPKTQTATASLVAALAELDNVKANKINPAFKARYVSLDALLDAIKPVLLDHDLALIQTLVSEDGKVGVSTAFLHASGERFDFGKLMVKAEGLTAQQIGGAITYIRRQSIQTACGISVDLARLEVHRDGKLIPLTPREGDIIEYLIRHRTRVVTRDDLLLDVWHYKSANVETRTVDIHIVGLRRKIELVPETPQVVQTVRGKGYRWYS